MSGVLKPAVDPLPWAPSPFKSRDGLRRVWAAWRCSAAGRRAAVRDEAAFRQELIVGVPLAVAAWWLGPTPAQILARVAVVVLVWVVELLDSAIEAVADAVTLAPSPLLGRASNLGGAAVMPTIVLAVTTWFVVLWRQGRRPWQTRSSPATTTRPRACSSRSWFRGGARRAASAA
jgi:diacylglycerol kinase (ATP)